MTPNERNQRIEDLRKQAAEPGADLPAIREAIATLLDGAKPEPTDTTVSTEMHSIKAERDRAYEAMEAALDWIAERDRIKAELAQARRELAEAGIPRLHQHITINGTTIQVTDFEVINHASDCSHETWTITGRVCE